MRAMRALSSQKYRKTLDIPSILLIRIYSTFIPISFLCHVTSICIVFHHVYVSCILYIIHSSPLSFRHHSIDPNYCHSIFTLIPIPIFIFGHPFTFHCSDQHPRRVKEEIIISLPFWDPFPLGL